MYAKGGIGKFQTIKTESYQSKNLPIFRLVDTRGIELNKNYGAKDVELETKNYINQQYKIYFHLIVYFVLFY